jgi:protein-S-isoprenylcysteine O-methyltransferase Ste14
MVVEAQMMAFRLVLFSGLLFHKLLWEVLKRRHAPPRSPKAAPKSAPLRIVKAFKVAVLGLLMCQVLFLNVLPISRRPAPLRRLGAALYLVGLVMAVTGRVQLGRNWADLEDSQVGPDQAVVTAGIYRLIRHPIYVGDTLLLAGLQLALNSWLALLSLGVVALIVKRAAAEETMLSQVLPAYAAYRDGTKRFIPFMV